VSNLKLRVSKNIEAIFDDFACMRRYSRCKQAPSHDGS